MLQIEGMWRGLFAIALVACTNASAPPMQENVSISAQPTFLTLAQGESQSIHVNVGASSQEPVTIGFDALPQGVTGTSAQWQGEPMVTIALMVAPDAPSFASQTIEVVATRNGAKRASAPIHVAVSSFDGSLDPSFGQNGSVQIQLQAGTFVKLPWIEPRPDGGWMAAGTTWDQSTDTKLIVVQLDATGAVQKISSGSAVPSIAGFGIESIAKSDQGVFAAGVAYGSPYASYAILFLDSEFAPTSVLPMQDDVYAVGFSGTTLLVPQLFPDLPGMLTITSYLGSPSGVYVTRQMPAGLFRYVPSGGTYALDSAFDASVVSANHDYLGAMATDASGRLLVGAAGSSDLGIVRVLQDGTLDTTFGSDGYASIPLTISGAAVKRIFELPSGDHLVIGQVSGSNTLAARFTADGALVQTFGTNGQTSYPAFQVLGAAMNAAATRVCTTDNDTIRCLRVAP